jgi:hypothetical protein
LRARRTGAARIDGRKQTRDTRRLSDIAVGLAQAFLQTEFVLALHYVPRPSVSRYRWTMVVRRAQVTGKQGCFPIYACR